MNILFNFVRRGESVCFFSLLLIFNSCVNNTDQPTLQLSPAEKTHKGFTDFEGAIAYEFNMIKNPTTGTIPDGIREQELAQAGELYKNQMLNTDIIAANTYLFQGPSNLGGRTRTIAYDIRFNGGSNRNILAGGVSGGVFKTIDDGGSWLRKSPVGDLFSVTSIVQDTRVGFRDTWYFSGGEWTGNSASAAGAPYRGKGVYKSTDNGETWSHLPASNTGSLEVFDHRADYITKLVVDPTNGNVYMAAMDAIYRSTDAGTTWSIILTSGSGGFGTGMATDIIVTSTGRFYASFAGESNGGPTLDMPGVWTSATGASGSWSKIAGSGAGTSPAGWNASGSYGRVVLAYAPSLESRVFALYSITVGACTIEAEFFRWDAGISTWTELSAFLPDEPGCSAGNDPFAVQGGYDLVVNVKPDDASVVFIGGTNIYRSTSGFTTTAATTRIGGYASPSGYSLYASSHPDIHAIEFSPISSTTMLCGNDGGIQRTTANLASPVVWSQINTGYRTYQYYYVELDPRIGNEKVLGGAQDNGSTRNVGGSGATFESVLGGDGVSVGLSDLIGGIQYEFVGFQNGDIIRRASTLPDGFGSLITPTGESGSGLFVTLFKLDADNSTTLYYANDNILYRTSSSHTVLSGTWTAMTGVATTVTAPIDITVLTPSRGLYSAAISSLFMGTSDGRILRLDDPTGVSAGTGPVDITGAGFPAGAYVSSIAVNPRNDDTILVTFSNYGVASAFWTGTANAPVPTWTAVEGTLSLPSFRSSSILLTPTGVQYFVGTSVGLYNVTGLPAITAWTQDGATEIGNAVVSSMSMRPSDNRLLVGTHGAGMWYTNILTPVPVGLVSFKGTLQNKNVLLQWSTSTESNSKHFELEKSFDGSSYRKITTILAAGFSNTVKKYSFTDFEKFSEKNYYRLRSVDLDFKEKLSDIVLIKPPGLDQEMIVLGNPFKSDINIRFVKATASEGELRLFDMSGRVVATQRFSAGEIQIRFAIPAGKLSRGNYMLQAIINKNKYLKQVLKD